MANNTTAAPNTTALLSAATTVAAGSAVPSVAATKTYVAKGATSSGTGASTIQVRGSIDGSVWAVIGTIALTLGTTAAAEGFTSDDRYPYVQGNVTAISGTGASVDLVMAH